MIPPAHISYSSLLQSFLSCLGCLVCLMWIVRVVGSEEMGGRGMGVWPKAKHTEFRILSSEAISKHQGLVNHFCATGIQHTELDILIFDSNFKG